MVINCSVLYWVFFIAAVPNEDAIVFLPFQRPPFLLKFRGLPQENGGELMSLDAVTVRGILLYPPKGEQTSLDRHLDW